MINKKCIEPSASILDAMKQIDRSAISTVVVCENGKVKGVLTDGDVRRALIKGAKLTASIDAFYTRNFISVGPDAMRADVLELMQARVIEQVPIVDQNGSLKGIHTLHELLGCSAKPNWAVIMAGGKGTRLGKLTESTPKPMLKVAGKPILERLVLHMLSYGIRRIFISVNHLSHVIEDYFEDGSKWGCSIEYLREDEPLGTAGSLSLLPAPPVNPIFVMNGDLVVNADLDAMLNFTLQGGFHATMAVKKYSIQVPYGCVEVARGVVKRIIEKPNLVRQVNAGIYILSPKATQIIPRRFCPITDVFNQALANGDKIGAFCLDGDWIDVGQHDQLKQARGELFQ